MTLQDNFVFFVFFWNDEWFDQLLLHPLSQIPKWVRLGSGMMPHMRMRSRAPPLSQEQQRRERMNLSSHLEHQNDTFEDDQPSQLHKEQHELPTLPKAKKNSDKIAGVINCCLSCVFVVVICFSLITLSVFAVADKSVKDIMNDKYNTSGCVLFGFYNKTYDPPLHFGNSKTCMFVIWGMAGISFINLLYLCGACFRILFGLVCGLSA